MNTSKEMLNICGKYIKDDILELPLKLIGSDQIMPVNFIIRAQMSISQIDITPSKLDFGTLYEGTGKKIEMKFDNLSLLPQELIFYPLPKEIKVEPDLIPITIYPKEKFVITIIYRGKEIKKDEGQLTLKVITGTISTKEIRINYTADIIKCPLLFSAYKVDFPVLQVEEKASTIIDIKNLTNQEMIYEFCLTEFEVSGLKVAPMVGKIEPNKLAQINLEYYSFYKKLGPFTMDELKKKFQNDTSRNIELLMKKKKEEKPKEVVKEEDIKDKDDKTKKQNEKKPEASKEKNDPKSQKGMTKQKQKELEDQQKQLELEKQKKEEEEKQKKLEIEKQFNIDLELTKLGGTFYEFDVGQKTYSQHYK